MQCYLQPSARDALERDPRQPSEHSNTPYRAQFDRSLTVSYMRPCLPIETELQTFGA